MRLIHGILGLGLLAGLASSAASGEIERLPAPSTKAAIATKRAWARMQQVRVSLDLQRMPVADALDYLRDVTRLKLVLSKVAREELSDSDVELDLKLDRITQADALRWVLDQGGLAASWRHGVLYVTTPDDLPRENVLRFYDVRDITLRIQDFPGPRVELEDPSAGCIGYPIGCFPCDPDDRPDVDTILDLILDLLQDEFDHDGTVIREMGSRIIVRNTEAVHAQVAEVIGLLRAAQ